MSALETIVEDLKGLSPTGLEEVGRLVHRLRSETVAARDEALRRSASLLSAEDGAELERIIEENCEKVDPREW